MKLFLSFFVIILVLTARLQAQLLHLNETDSVRVWLFEDKTLRSGQISLYEGSASVIVDSDTLFFLAKGESSLDISRVSDGIRLDDSDEMVYPTVFIHATGNSLLRVSLGKEQRIVRGHISIDTKGKHGSIRIINSVSLEDYVTSVIAGEMPFVESEALKSQAVIARTYALWNKALAKRSDYDVTDHTASQVYIGEPVTKPWVRNAAEATAGEVLTWSGKLILSAYFSTSGGTTTGNELVWRGKPLPYLRPIDDGDASQDSPHFNWTFTESLTNVKAAFKTTFSKDQKALEILEKDESGRVVTVRVGEKKLSGQDFRMVMISKFGPKSLKSTLFDVSIADNSVVFSGKGMGHGVGLSQWGAYGLSRSGWSYVEILKFYYSGVEVSNIHYLENALIELAN